MSDILSLSDDELGPNCEPDDGDAPHYGYCDCCGKYMIDDCERGCGTCYECQAWIAKTTEQETTPCDPQAPPAPDAPSPS